MKIQTQASWLVTLALVALAGCGGGGDGDSTTPPTGGGNPPPSGGGNVAPTIQGQPSGSVVAGQAFSFQPTAADANGDPLTFSVVNLPAWASFSTSTGRISGTPAAADVATYSGIRVSVSDGQATASTGVFAIAVLQAASGNVTLSWTPPTQNDDGSALTDLARYEVRYGRSQNDLSQSVEVTNPSISTYVVENLSAGTWFFAVRSVNSNGVSSQLSGVASKTVS
jgi:Putative Ig domain